MIIGESELTLLLICCSCNAIERLAKESRVRAVVLSVEVKGFCAGLDFENLAVMQSGEGTQLPRLTDRMEPRTSSIPDRYARFKEQFRDRCPSRVRYPPVQIVAFTPCPEVLFLMGLRTPDQHLVFFDTWQTKGIHNDEGDVVVLE